MKSRILLFAAAAMMLASCTMQQRVHQPGWYFQFDGLSKKHEKVDQPQVKEAAQQAPEEQVAVVESTESVAPLAISETAIAPTAALTSTQKPAKKESVEEMATPIFNDTKIISEVPAEQTAFRKQVLTPLYKATGGASTNQILLIILALLLPPLALYLHEGASTLFWVTLILCLFGGGYLFAPFFGSFWFIAALLAILRILGVI